MKVGPEPIKWRYPEAEGMSVLPTNGEPIKWRYPEAEGMSALPTNGEPIKWQYPEAEVRSVLPSNGEPRPMPLPGSTYATDVLPPSGPPCSPPPSLPDGNGDFCVQEQAKQFKTHMDAMIKQSCDELQRKLESLYHRHFDVECPPRDFPKVEVAEVGQAAQAASLEGSDIDAECEVAKSRSRPSALQDQDLDSDLESENSFDKIINGARSAMLENALSRAETLESRIRRKGPHATHDVWWWILYEIHPWEWFEPAIAFVILANIAYIGFSMDAPTDSVTVTVLDVVFLLVFVAEVAINIKTERCRGYFCGKEKISNCFNVTLILLDLFDLIQRMNYANLQPEGTPNTSLLRVLRILKISRVLRLLRWSALGDLTAMMQGMLLGMPTLGWSMVLFLGTIYVFALVFHEALRKEDALDGMFDTVSRSIYTTFRCSFGDCSGPAGTPIFEHVQLHFGWVWSLVYCIFLYTISIGLFNVISAVFVEATIRSAAKLDLKTKQARLQNDDLWSVQVATLLRRLVGRHVPEPLDMFTCSWEEHCDIPLQVRLEDVQKSKIMVDITADAWMERLCVTDRDGKQVDVAPLFRKDGKPLDCLSTLPEGLFPVTAKLRAPKAFRDVCELKDDDPLDFDLPLTENFKDIAKLAYGGRTIDKWVKDEKVIHALDELDIDPQDHDRLSDILDPQNDGQVPVLDLIDGIRRLRGFPLRSDIVCIDLMIRQNQKLHHKLDHDVENIEKGMHELRFCLEGLKDQVQDIRSALGS